MPISLTGTLEALGAFPLVDQADLLGSYRAVADTTARDAIITQDRAEGMLVRTNATNQWWRLGAGLTNADWVEVFIEAPTTSPIDIYVATTGNDANDGLTALTAVATMARAMEIVPDALAAPVIVHVASGTYAWSCKSPKALTPDARLYIWGDGAGQVGDDGFTVIASGVAGATTTTTALELAVDPGTNVYMGYTLECQGAYRAIYRNAGAPSLAYVIDAVAGMAAGSAYRVLRPAVIFTYTGSSPELAGQTKLGLINLAFSNLTAFGAGYFNECDTVIFGVECGYRMVLAGGTSYPGYTNSTIVAEFVSAGLPSNIQGWGLSVYSSGFWSFDKTVLPFDSMNIAHAGLWIAGTAYVYGSITTTGLFRGGYAYLDVYTNDTRLFLNYEGGSIDLTSDLSTGGLSSSTNPAVIVGAGVAFCYQGSNTLTITRTGAGNVVDLYYNGATFELSGGVTITAANNTSVAIAGVYGAMVSILGINTIARGGITVDNSRMQLSGTTTVTDGAIVVRNGSIVSQPGSLTHSAGNFSVTTNSTWSLGAALTVATGTMLVTQGARLTATNTITVTASSLTVSLGAQLVTSGNVTAGSSFSVLTGSLFDSLGGGTTTMSAGTFTVSGGSTVLTNALSVTGTTSIVNSTFVFNGNTTLPATTFTDCKITQANGAFTIPSMVVTGGSFTQTGGTWSFTTTLDLNGARARVTTALTGVTTLTLTQGAELTITAGTQSIGTLSLASNSRVEIVGGTFTATTATTLAGGSEIVTSVAFTTAAWTQTDSTFIATAGLFSISADSTALTIGTNSRFAAYGGITLGVTTGGGITVGTGATFYVSGGTVNMRTSGLTTSVGANTYFGPTALTTCNAITVNGGTFVLAMTPTIAGSVSFTRAYVQLTNNLTVTGTVGGGTTGALTISGGVVQFPGSISCETLTLNNEAIVQLNGALTVASGSASGSILVTENSLLLCENNVSYTTASSAGMTVSNGGQVNIAAGNYAGNTSPIAVTNGILRFYPAAVTTTVTTLTVTQNSTLDWGVSATLTGDITFTQSKVYINAALTTSNGAGSALSWTYSTINAAAAITANAVNAGATFTDCTVQSSSTLTVRGFAVNGGNVYFAGAVTVNATSFSVTNGATFACNAGIAVTGTFGVTNSTLVFAGATTSSAAVTITDSNVQASGSFTATSQNLNIYGSRFVSSSSITAGATTISRSSIVECTTFASSTTTITNARVEAVTSVTLSGDLTVSDGAVFKTATLSGNTGARNVTINSGSSVSLTTATTNLGVFTIDNARLTMAGNLTCASASVTPLVVTNGGVLEHTSGTLTATLTAGGGGATASAAALVAGGATLTSIKATLNATGSTNTNGLEVRSGGVVRFVTATATDVAITATGTGYGIYASGGSCWFEGFNPTSVVGGTGTTQDLKAGGTSSVADTTISAVNNYVTDTAGSNIGRAA